MLDWLIQNLPTILVALVVLAVCTLIVIKIIKDKKQGKSSCSCGCSSCAMKELCHTQSTPRSEQSNEASKEQEL